MLRSAWILLFIFVLCGLVEAAAPEDPHLTVILYNDAAIPGPVLKKTKEVVQKIYQDAGIVLVWKDHSDSRAGMSQFFVRIVSRSLNLPGDDFGIAFVGTDGQGVQADVFYSGIERLANNTPANPGEIAGHVIAHELGHLLLGMNSHSNLGIMQAHWTDRQLRQMSMGVLKFDKRQSEIIGARLLGVHVGEGELRGY